MQFTSQETKAMWYLSSQVQTRERERCKVHEWENIVLVVCVHVQTRIGEKMIMYQRVNGRITLILILPSLLVLKEMVQCADQKSFFLIKHLMEIFR